MPPALALNVLPASPEEWRDEGRLVAAGLIGALIVYGYPVTHFALHIDGEMGAAYGTVANNIALGRWGIALLRRTLLPDPFAPFFTPLVSLLFHVLSGTVSGRLIGLRGAPRMAFTLLHGAFPQFAYQLEFPVQSDCVGIALFCAAVSSAWMRCALRGELRVPIAALAAAVALFAFAIGVYQSILFVPASIFLAWAGFDLARGTVGPRQVLREATVVAAVALLALLLSTIIGRAVQTWSATPGSDYLLVDVGWTRMPVATALRQTVIFLERNLTGRAFYGSGLYGTTLVPLLLLICPDLRSRDSRAILGALCWLALWVAPFLPIVALGQNQAPRVFLSEAISFAALWSAAFAALPRLRRAAAAIVAVALLTGSLHVSRLFFADSMAFTADLAVATEIMARIHAVDPAFDPGRRDVLFSGGFQPEAIWTRPDFDVFGRSFFAWDNGRPVRIEAFFLATGLARLHPPAQTTVARITPEMAALPPWPASGAVALIEGVVVVKLGR